jgi:isopenicillin-N epimerase
VTNDASELSRHWTLDPEVVFLNHGSFGACPSDVLACQSELRARLEREPVRFMMRELEGRLDGARESAARFIGAEPEGLAFVPNATAGVNAVLRSLRLAPGDELVVTDHAYNACRNVLEHAAREAGARVCLASLPFPIAGTDAVVERVMAVVGPRTRLALLEHVTSPTGLVLPLGELVPALRERGVDSLVDGAHAPGMLELDLAVLDPAYYAGNFHKWVCAPKGAGFLYARRDRREGVRPPVISHGANSPRSDRSRYWLEFDWMGTHDPTPALCVPRAIDVVGSLLPGGWPAVRAHNHALALEARRRVAGALGIDAEPAPASMLGSLASLPVPGPVPQLKPAAPIDPLQDRLLEHHHIEVPVFPGPARGQRLIRLSSHLYNAPAQYDRLAAALAQELARS